MDHFKDDIDEIMSQAQISGVEKILLPNIDSETIDAMLYLEKAYKGRVYAMMGLHPCHVKENYKEELSIIKTELDKRTYIAVGEIGIDLYWDKQYLEQQKDAFIIQTNWAYELGIPIVIHARESMNILLDILEDLNLKGLIGVFHCFGGDRYQLDRIQNLGFKIGLGGVITYKKSDMSEVLTINDIDSIILETDAPYLPPVPYRGKRNESSYIPIIAQKLSEILNMSLDQIKISTTQNALDLFEL
jgi:TatD DNase family protein